MNELSKDQQAAIDHMSNWYDEVKNNQNTNMFILKGYAGTGKSTLMKTFNKLKNLNPSNDILTLATSGIAVKNIKEKTNSDKAQTIASFIKTPITEYSLQLINTDVNSVIDVDLSSNNTSKLTGAELLNQTNLVIGKETKKFTSAEIQKITNYIDGLKRNISVRGSKTGNFDLTQNDQIAFNETMEDFKLKTWTPQLIGDLKFITRDLTSARQILANVKVIIIDEVGMVSQYDLDLINDLARKAYENAVTDNENFEPIPIIGLGDENQLKPVNSEFNWQLLNNQPTHIENNSLYGVETSKLTTIHRQTNDSYINELAQYFTQNYNQNTVNLQNAIQSVQATAKNENSKIKDIVCDSLNRLNDKQIHQLMMNSDAIITYTKKSVTKLTKLAREEKYGESVDDQLKVGDTILITQNEQKKSDDDDLLEITPLANGERFEITKIYQSQDLDTSNNQIKQTYENNQDVFICVDMKNKNEIIEKAWLNTINFDTPNVNKSTILNNNQTAKYRRQQTAWNKITKDKNILSDHNLNKELLYATFGYALTVHKAQGLEFNNVIYYEPSWMTNKPNYSNLRYTAITRAKNAIMLLSD